VLTGLDNLAGNHPNVVLIATTNEEDAVDPAFLSRVDLREHFGLPDDAIIAQILAATLAQFDVVVRPDDPELLALAGKCAALGLDARRARKLVLRALVGNGPELALAPKLLTMNHVRHALDSLDSE